MFKVTLSVLTPTVASHDHKATSSLINSINPATVMPPTCFCDLAHISLIVSLLRLQEQLTADEWDKFHNTKPITAFQ